MKTDSLQRVRKFARARVLSGKGEVFGPTHSTCEDALFCVRGSKSRHRRPIA